MEMSKEKYAELIRRFSQELHEVGVTSDMKEIVTSQSNRIPNTASCGTEEQVSRFVYQHAGYQIEATCTVELKLKKCK